MKNIMLYKMYPSWCTNCNVSFQGQIPTFILVTCLLCISSDDKNKVKRLSFPYLDSKTIHTYTPRHIDIQEETSIIPSLYVLLVCNIWWQHQQRSRTLMDSYFPRMCNPLQCTSGILQKLYGKYDKILHILNISINQ